MPRPTEDPEWASDSAYDAPGKAWDGVDPKLEPPAGLIGEGWEPGVAPNARFFNWLLNLFARWLEFLRDERDRIAPYVGGDTGADEWAYPTGRARQTTHLLDTFVFMTDAAGAPYWSRPNTSVFPVAHPLATDVFAYCHLRLPTGAILTSVDVFLHADSSLRAGAQRWQFQVYVQDWPASLDPALSAAIDDGGASGQTVVNVPLTAPYTVQSDEVVQVRIQGPDGPDSTDDYVIAVRANWTDPGPRNF